MRKPSILIIRANELSLNKNRTFLFSHGFELIQAPDYMLLSEIFSKKNPDIVIIGSKSQYDMEELKLITEIRKNNPQIPIILIVKYSSEDRVIAAFKKGVNDYFRIPFSMEELLKSLKENLSNSLLDKKGLSFDECNKKINCDTLVGKSDLMQDVKDYLLKVSKSDSTVLITGETGTGKELAASIIHCESFRYNKPMIRINCAAIPENLVESELFGYEKGAFTGAANSAQGKLAFAEGGSIFLDEIGDMDLFAQAKILRCIENKEVYPLGGNKATPLDIRFIAATNQNPEDLIVEGKFRKDLYYRLNIASIYIPPLRKRKEDIPELVKHGIQKFNNRFHRNLKGLTDETISLFLQYDWPGNVRELMNVLEATYINLPLHEVHYAEMPKQLQVKFKKLANLPIREHSLIISALTETDWNKSTAAKKLKWSRTTLYRKMAKYKIEKPISRVT